MPKTKFIVMLIMLFIQLNAGQLFAQPTERIDILYFHATIRCDGCLSIENHIKNTIYSDFENQLADSSMTLSSLDFLQPCNEHFQDDYKFDQQTLILSKKVDGKEVKWKNLDKIWEYSANYEKFRNYLKKEIDKFNKK